MRYFAQTLHQHVALDEGEQFDYRSYDGGKAIRVNTVTVESSTSENYQGTVVHVRLSGRTVLKNGSLGQTARDIGLATPYWTRIPQLAVIVNAVLAHNTEENRNAH